MNWNKYPEHLPNEENNLYWVTIVPSYDWENTRVTLAVYDEDTGWYTWDGYTITEDRVMAWAAVQYPVPFTS